MQVEIAKIVTLLREGSAVIFPTETVYALAVDARNSNAIASVFELKKRHENKPLALIGNAQSMVENYITTNTPTRRVMSHFMPGAFTCILPTRPNHGLPPQLLPKNQTLGVRVPDHAMAQEIISQLGAPLAATSVNLSGAPAANCLEDVKIFCHGTNLAYCAPRSKAEEPQGLASTVIDFSTPSPTLLREGVIGFDEVMDVYQRGDAG